jgi:hypothetical protein
MILGTLLLLVVIGGGLVGAWKYRAMMLGDRGDEQTPLHDDVLIALARERDAALARSASRSEPSQSFDGS